MKMSKQAPFISNRKSQRGILIRRMSLHFIGIMLPLLIAAVAWGQTVYVNRWYGGMQPSDGTPDRPFRTLRGAYDRISSGTIQVETGVYPETFPLAKPITLTAHGGPVIIGVSSPNVLTQHNNNQRTGANLNEKILNVANVRTNFGRIADIPVDGRIHAQPLYVSNVTIPGQGIYNFVYVATGRNRIYAFNADWPYQKFWEYYCGSPVSRADIFPPLGDPWIGIVGTPVIDLQTNTLYAVAMTKDGPNRYVHRLHAIDIVTGRHKTGLQPVEIQGRRTIRIGPWTITIVFNPLNQNQRAALCLENGNIYIAWAAFADQRAYDGLLMSYNAATLQKQNEFVVAYLNEKGGIWQSGGGPATDNVGNLYITTGNNDIRNHRSIGFEFDESIVKLSPSLGVLDYFTAWNHVDLNNGDWDLGVSGPMTPPDQPGRYPHLLITGSKQGSLYVINRDDMGRFNERFDRIVQTVQAYPMDFNHHIHATPVYWASPQGNRVYTVCENDDPQYGLQPIKTYKIENGQFFYDGQSRDLVSADQMSLSSNGSDSGTGILWLFTHDNVLRAFNAETLEQIYSSSRIPSDTLGDYPRFGAPTIANGKVYAPTFSNVLKVYGLR